MWTKETTLYVVYSGFGNFIASMINKDTFIKTRPQKSRTDVTKYWI